MANIPSKVAERISNGLKKFQPIISSAVARDVNESDTVMIVSDILNEIFGYDKYSEVTREYAIRGTYVDLAIKLESKLRMLIEVKNVGVDLKDGHKKQATDYAANQGVDWVVLTNGIQWQLHRVSFVKPIDTELILEFNLLELNHKHSESVENLYLISRESLVKADIDEFHIHRQVMNKFAIAAIIVTEPVLLSIRRELKRLTTNLSIDVDEIESIIMKEVLKREVVEGDKAIEAKKKITKALSKPLRIRNEKKSDNGEKSNLNDNNNEIEN